MIYNNSINKYDEYLIGKSNSYIASYCFNPTNEYEKNIKEICVILKKPYNNTQEFSNIINNELNTKLQEIIISRIITSSKQYLQLLNICVRIILFLDNVDKTNTEYIKIIEGFFNNDLSHYHMLLNSPYKNLLYTEKHNIPLKFYNKHYNNFNNKLPLKFYNQYNPQNFKTNKNNTELKTNIAIDSYKYVKITGVIVVSIIVFVGCYLLSLSFNNSQDNNIRNNNS